MEGTKRFGNKCLVVDNKVFSYKTHVATIEYDRKLLIHGKWSVTTSKHIDMVAYFYGLIKFDDPV